MKGSRFPVEFSGFGVHPPDWINQECCFAVIEITNRAIEPFLGTSASLHLEFE
jgi:hypothetical protein